MTKLPAKLAEMTAQWMRENGYPAVYTIRSMEATSYDHSDTDGCGCDEASIEVRWLATDGSKGVSHLLGYEVARLWNWLVTEP